MYKNNIELRICVNGRAVKEYTHKGMQFIESRHGSNYSIKLKNDGGSRVMAVVSVDGLDVITGKPAEKTNKGYIVDAYSSTEIKGYRLSDNDSAAFVFVSKDKSYVAGTEDGDKRNSGVIGVRVFEEKPEKIKVIEKHIHHNHYPVYPWNPYPTTTLTPTYPTYPTWTCATGTSIHRGCLGATGGSGLGADGRLDSANVYYGSNQSVTGQSVNCVPSTVSSVTLGGGTTGTATNVSAPVKNDFDNAINVSTFDTGTGWGDKQVDKVKKEYFRKGKVLGELVVYYASTDALVGMGIDLSTTPIIAEAKKLPKAFGDSEYCQPPKNWQGNR